MLRLTQLLATGLLLLACAGMAFSQAPAPPGPPITPVLDPATRSIRLDPTGQRVRIPDEVSIRGFTPSTNAMSLDMDVAGGRSMGLEIAFGSSSCADWHKSKAQGKYGGKPRTQKANALIYDSRWYPTYFDRNDWIYVCLDRPGGIVVIESTPLKGQPVVPFVHMTANIADALLPDTVKAVGSSGMPAATSSVSVDNVYPQYIQGSALRCRTENSASACEAVRTFEAVRQSCSGTSAVACYEIAEMAATFDDQRAAATYYQRACDLGETTACKKAKSSARKAGR